MVALHLSRRLAYSNLSFITIREYGSRWNILGSQGYNVAVASLPNSHFDGAFDVK